jgi:hypothetical protein
MRRLGSWQLLSTFPVSHIYSRKSTLDKSHCLSGQNLSKKGKHKNLPRKHHCLGSWLREKMREFQFLGKIRETQILTEKLTTDDTGSNWNSRVLDARCLGSWWSLLSFPESRIFSRKSIPETFSLRALEFARELTTGISREWVREYPSRVKLRDQLPRPASFPVTLLPRCFTKNVSGIVLGKRCESSGIDNFY